MRKGRNSRPAKVARVTLLGPPPLITGEDADAYDELLARVSAGIEPKDFLEEIWVRDIVDLEWEIMRMRRMKAGLFTAKAYQSLHVVLSPITDEDMREYDSERIREHDSEVEQEEEDEIEDRFLAKNWAQRRPAAVNKVNRLLAHADLTMDAVNAHTLLKNIDAMERIERMIAVAEARRNASLREIDCHRESLAVPSRRNLKQIEDAEYKVINIKPAEGK